MIVITTAEAPKHLEIEEEYMGFFFAKDWPTEMYVLHSIKIDKLQNIAQGGRTEKSHSCSYSSFHFYTQARRIEFPAGCRRN